MQFLVDIGKQVLIFCNTCPEGHLHHLESVNEKSIHVLQKFFPYPPVSLNMFAGKSTI